MPLQFVDRDDSGVSSWYLECDECGIVSDTVDVRLEQLDAEWTPKIFRALGGGGMRQIERGLGVPRLLEICAECMASGFRAKRCAHCGDKLSELHGRDYCSERCTRTAQKLRDETAEETWQETGQASGSESLRQCRESVSQATE
jgi:hypothetical protein